MARDERELRKTIKELKSHILSLRKQLITAETELANVKSLWEDDEVVAEAKKIRREKLEKVKEEDRCKGCNEPIKSITIGKWQIVNCPLCGKRERHETLSNQI